LRLDAKVRRYRQDQTLLAEPIQYNNYLPQRQQRDPHLTQYSEVLISGSKSGFDGLQSRFRSETTFFFHNPVDFLGDQIQSCGISLPQSLSAKLLKLLGEFGLPLLMHWQAVITKRFWTSEQGSSVTPVTKESPRTSYSGGTWRIPTVHRAKEMSAGENWPAFRRRGC
jgi:hypothetical protein